MADEFTPDELMEQIVDLEIKLEEANQKIAELTADQIKGGKKKGNKADEQQIAQLEAEMEELHDKLEQNVATITTLREELATSNIKVTQVTSEKLEVERKSKTQADRIKDLEKEISKITSESALSKQQSKSAVEQNSLNFKQSQRVSEENQQLKAEMEGLRQQIQQMEEEKDSLEQALAHLDDELQQASNERDTFELDKQELQTNIITVSRELETIKSELDDTLNKENEWRLKHDDLKVQVKQLTTQLNTEKANSAKEITSLQDTIKMLKDTTKLGEKQRKIDQLEKLQAEHVKEIDSLKAKLDDAALERDHLAENLLEIDDNLDTKVAEKISNERHKVRQLEIEIESLKQQNAENVAYYKQTERDRNDLSSQVDELLAWKSIYEAGHGLQELSRSRKKLQDDNRRLTVEVEQLSTNVDMIRNTNNVISLAFDKLKAECGKKPNFQYPEYELQIEVQSVINKLRAQVLELESQVFELEKENTKVRIAMKNQAGSISEAGFKYAGMSAEMLLKVNDFANNLRDGKLDLPLDDQSRTLHKENKRLKEELNNLNIQLQRYERELGGSLGATGSDVMTNNDMNKILQDNKELHNKMNQLQSELVNLIRQSRTPRAAVTTASASAETGGVEIHSGIPMPGMISQDELLVILSKNNDLILNELQQLRDVASAPTAMVPEQNLPPNYYNLPASRFPQYQQIPQQYQPQAVSYQSDNNVKPPMSKPVMTRQSSLGVSGATPAKLTVSTPAPYQTPIGPQGQVPQLWTAGMARGGMPFAPGTPAAHSTYTGGPATPHGKQLLHQSLSQMQLPPEEWAVDMKDLNAQLIECLEQLYDRDQELNESTRVIAALEESLVAIKQQMATLYYDYSQRNDAWEAREKQLKADCTAVNNERDDLKLKLSRVTELNNTIKQENPESIHARLIELTRKLTIYEVNETILSRKYISQSEQLAQVEKAKQHLEVDFIEMESGLKKRILYLEQYKLTVSSRMSHLQSKLDSSVSNEDYLQLQLELENLRDDHLNTLRREVEARMACLKSTDCARELRAAKIMLAHLNIQCESSNSAVMSLEAELIHQKEASERAVKAVNSTSDVAMIISEMARFRGEASRLEVELLAANRRSELLAERVSSISQEADTYQLRVKELEGREIENSSKESDARKKLLETQLKYEGGLTKFDADNLKTKHDKCVRELEEAHRDVIRYRELAEIAAQQATSLSAYKKQYTDEIAELREYCTRLESHSEDELLIGRLTRELQSNLQSHRAFVRKYNVALQAMRKREIAMRILESRLDEQEKSISTIQDAARLEINGLKKALRNMKNTVVEDNSQVASKAIKHGTVAVINSEGDKRVKRGNKNLATILTVSIGEKLLNMSNKVDELSIMAEDAVARASAAEKECLELRGEREDLLTEKVVLEQRSLDLMETTKSRPNEKKIADRFYMLSEEIRTTKLSGNKQLRQIQELQLEKRKLQSLLSNIEADVNELEEDKVKAETNKLLFDVQQDIDAEKQSNLLGSTSLFGDTNAVNDLDDNAPHSTFKKQSKKATEKVQGVVGKLKLEINDLDEAADELTPDELLKKLRATNEQLQATQREISEERLTINNMKGRMEEMQAILSEKDKNIDYYEKVIRDHNLGDVSLKPMSEKRRGHQPQSSIQSQLQKEQQEKLQIAASATINSLNAIIQEKNQLIEKYREKLESQKDLAHQRSRAEKRADDLLERYKIEDELIRKQNLQAGYSSKKDKDMDDPDGPYKKLLDQMGQGDRIIAEKEELIRELELKLNSTQNKCERAEVRCGETLQEIENMKADMLTLVDQLNEAQAKAKMYATTRGGHSSPIRSTPAKQPAATEVRTVGGDAMMLLIDPTNLNKKLEDCEKRIKKYKEKMASYHDVIMKLKDEFIKSETDHAEKVRQLTKAAEDYPRSRGGDSDGPRGGSSRSDLSDFKHKMDDMKKDLLETKTQLRHVKELNDRMKADHKEATADLEKQLEKMETLCAAKEQSNERLKREFEETKRKEVRLRARLQEMLSGDGTNTANKGSAGNVTSLAKARERIDNLERELDIVKAQNIALKKDSYLQANGPGGDLADDRRESPARGGRVLGTGTGPVDESRQAAQAKWEQDKKMKHRVETLEKRLKEKIDEVDDLKKEVAKLTSLAQQAMTNKEDKKTSHSSTAKKVDDNTRRLTADDLSALEEAQMNVFVLEQELARVVKIADVDRVNEISRLESNLRNCFDEIKHLKEDLADSERRRKQMAAGGPVDDREDRLVQLLDEARRQKLEFERDVLENAANANANRFELETSENKIRQLERRLNESQANYRSAAAINAASGVGSRKHTEVDTAYGSVMTGTGVRSKREKELESTIDSLRVTVEKLQAENSRYKKGNSPEDHKVHDAEKKYLAEKKKVEKLEEELSSLTVKAKNNEDSSQKIVQHQMKITQLRKQLKQKEDEFALQREQAETIAVDKESLRKKVVVLEEKIQQLEIALQQSTNTRHAPAPTTRAEAQQQQQRENELKGRIEDLSTLNERLKSELQDARKVLQSSHFNQTTGGSSGPRSASGATASAGEVEKLREENAKLRQELSAFDLDFFEEIENLKYAHAEAMQKLKVYQQRESQSRTAGGSDYRRGY